VGERRELALAVDALRAHPRVYHALGGGLRVAASPLRGLLQRCDLAAHLDEILLGGSAGDIGHAGATGEDDQPNGR
jgi:hypothetical protein